MTSVWSFATAFAGWSRCSETFCSGWEPYVLWGGASQRELIMTRKLLVAWDLQLSLGVLKDRDFSLVLMSSFTEKNAFWEAYILKQKRRETWATQWSNPTIKKIRSCFPLKGICPTAGCLPSSKHSPAPSRSLHLDAWFLPHEFHVK